MLDKPALFCTSGLQAAVRCTVLLAFMFGGLWAPAHATAGSLGQDATDYPISPWPTRQQTPIGPLKLKGLNGQIVHTGLGKQVVLLNFWATWCPPCLAEMPSLELLSQRIGPERLRIVAINVKESNATIEAFVERNGLSLPAARDAQGALAQRWGIKVYPSTLVVAADGRVKWLVRGEFNWAGPEAAALLKPLLAQSGLPHQRAKSLAER